MILAPTLPGFKPLSMLSEMALYFQNTIQNIHVYTRNIIFIGKERLYSKDYKYLPKVIHVAGVEDRD